MSSHLATIFACLHAPAILPMRLLLCLLVFHLTTCALAQEPVSCDVDDAEACAVAQLCAPTENGGVCVSAPVGGAVVTTRRSRFPVPVAYFPLTGDSVDSWPVASRSGTVRGAIWLQDHEFGSALHCLENLRDIVTLDNVPIGRRGSFTINLWIKKSPTSSFGGQFNQFFFSATSASNDDPIVNQTDPNQIHFLLPERDNVGYGVVRTIVRDGNDEGGSFHLDSDGQVNSTTEKPRGSRSGVDFVDGEWHMVTVTTLPERRGRVRNGYRMFVDGEVVAEANDAAFPGGDSMEIDGPLYLCGHANDDPVRHFDGSLAKLSIFDEALTPEQVEAMYVAVRQSTIARQVSSNEELQIWNTESNLTLYVDTENNIRYVRGPEVDRVLLGRSDDSASTTLPNEFSLEEFLKDVELCPTSPAAFGLNSEDYCSEDEVCAGVHHDMLSILHRSSNLGANESFALTGICTKPPRGGSLWRGEDSGVPAPLAYFPMTADDLRAWPVPNALGTEVGASLVRDNVFGRVYQCDQRRRSFIILDNVHYGQLGPFAINFWFKPMNLSGSVFQYLFSHGSFVPNFNPWVPNQVQILLSEDDSQVPGIVRAIVKDTSDRDIGLAGRMFLDSDGDVALTTLKDPVTSAMTRPVNTTDGNWHMITLTSRVDFRKGFSMYLDGVLVGEIREDLFYTGDDGTLRPATGGDALRPGGKIYLCGRYDGDAERHFSGRIAEVMLFDQPLRDDQVLTLYESAVLQQPGLIGRKLMQQTDIGTAVESNLVPVTEQDTRIDGFPLGSWWGNFLSNPGTQFGRCSGNFVPEDAERDNFVLCGPSLTCLPIQVSDGGEGLERAGTCVEFPAGGAYVFDSENEIEVPMAYFPLVGGRLNSFPIPSFAGRHLRRQSVFVEDDVFGSVIDCSRSVNDSVVLDSVPYASQNGDFTVALWMRRRGHHEGKDNGFETLFSHIRDPDEFGGLLDPNQIQILLVTEEVTGSSFVRAVVRDDDDTDNEFRFVDGDAGDVNVTDGDWHMIAVTSHPTSRHGFRLYVDGVMAGELRGRSALGGNRMRLFSDMHLCSGADGSGMNHFDGSVAHLVLWDTALSAQEIFALYERLILVSEDVQVEHPLRRTVDGDVCLFPAILQGEVVTDCAPLDDALKCPIRDGTWKQCEEFDADDDGLDIEAVPALIRTTIDGEPCMMPGRFGQRDVFGCVDMNGVFSCEFRRGQWKQCSSLIKLRYTVDGMPCVFPFTYQGMQYSDCVQTEVSSEICQIANGEFEECAPAVTEDLSGPPSLPPRSMTEVTEIVGRKTVTDEPCRFPWWFEDLSVGGCVEIAGTPSCETVNGTVEECAPIVYTLDRSPCVFPYPTRSSMQFSCIDRRGADMCRVANGSWAMCEPQGRQIPVNEPLPLFPGRVTVTNESCLFPFWFEGASVSDCVGNSVKQCETVSGGFEECQPKRVTIDGESCSFPFMLEGEMQYTCIEMDGTEQCRTVGGSFGICAPVSSTAERSRTRIAVTGEFCVFPFDHDGESQLDCVEIGGEEVCRVEDGRWATCAPVIEMALFHRTTVSGDECSMPFVHENQLFADCFVSDDGREKCRTEDEDGPLAECVARTGNEESESVFVEYPAERNTTEGAACAFPFHYEGGWWVDCVTMDETESCKDANGDWHECTPLQQRRRRRRRRGAQRFTVDGRECVFPVMYNGEEFLDCVEINGTESCKDADDDWDECEPLQNRERPSATRRRAVNDEACVFPLFYNGEEFDDCVVINGTEQCKVEGDVWQECLPREDDPRLNILSEREGPETNAGNEDSSSSSSLSGGAVAGIVIVVLIAAIALVAVAGYALLKTKQNQEKNFERTSSKFEKMGGDDRPEGIAMSDMGRVAERVKKTGSSRDVTYEIPL